MIGPPSTPVGRVIFRRISRMFRVVVHHRVGPENATDPEQTSRRARLMELDPRYGDVMVKR